MSVANVPTSSLMDRVHEVLRTLRYSPRTRAVYASWVRRFVIESRTTLDGLTASHVEAFLGRLAAAGVAPATHNQALAALLFLFSHVLCRPLERHVNVARATPPLRIPVVLTPTEVAQVFEHLEGQPRLMTALLYGSGLRLLECCTLRIKDVDLERREIRIRDGKGRKDRVTTLPERLIEPLREHIEDVRLMHQADLAAGAGWVAVPDALSRKYPNAGREWPWQWVFPAMRHYTEPASRQQRRHHFHQTALQRAVRVASLKAGISKRVSPHAFRHYPEPLIIPRSRPVSAAPRRGRLVAPGRRGIIRLRFPHAGTPAGLGGDHAGRVLRCAVRRRAIALLPLRGTPRRPLLVIERSGPRAPHNPGEAVVDRPPCAVDVQEAPGCQRAQRATHRRVPRR